tara:strand:- start:1597 stop:2109 length:513 start_codon:yes stop_codon:yes gene_type:complete
MNDLQEYFENNEHGDMVYKWTHSFEVYDRHLSRFRGTDVGILEIGVAEGGSLKMWADYFGPDAKVYGIDIKPECKQVDNKQIKVFIGSQTDKYFLYDVASHVPKIDIVIDDGGHIVDSCEMGSSAFRPRLAGSIRSSLVMRLLGCSSRASSLKVFALFFGETSVPLTVQS